MKHRRKRISAPRVLPPPATRPHERWSLDFLTDSLADGHRFRILTFVDNVSRVSPAIEVGTSLTGDRVVAILEGLKRTVGVPQRIAIDNGPEFVSKALDAWAYRNRVQLEFSRPGKPTDNAYAESFNGHFRAECLDQHWFASLEEARQTIESWRVEDQHGAPPPGAPAAGAGGLDRRLGPAPEDSGLTLRMDQIGEQVTCRMQICHGRTLNKFARENAITRRRVALVVRNTGLYAGIHVSIHFFEPTLLDQCESRNESL